MSLYFIERVPVCQLFLLSTLDMGTSGGGSVYDNRRFVVAHRVPDGTSSTLMFDPAPFLRPFHFQRKGFGDRPTTLPFT